VIETGKIERAELYKDRSVQILFDRLLGGEMNEIEPAYDSELGYHYPIVEEIVGDKSKVKRFLQKLHEAGMLRRRLFDKTLHCPKCSSTNVSVHYCCPYCKSFNIDKSSLVEHIKCGYMDVEENFKKGQKFVCPKCQDELKKPDIDHRRAGVWCTCRDCRKSFDVPHTQHFCRTCRATSTFEDAIIEDVHAYSLDDQVKEEVGVSWVVINPIRELLSGKGYDVESPAFLEGKSGAKHMFDIAAYKGKTKQKVLVMDLAFSTEKTVPEQPVIALFAKIFDVGPSAAYLIAIPKMSENGKKMSELYSITIIEAKNQNEVIEALAEVVIGK